MPPIRASTKAGNPRKSRRKRLPMSFGSGGDVKFTPDPADWQRFEESYGRVLLPEMRGDLVILVDTYFRWQPSEQGAPFADDALAYFNRFEKAARKLWDVMLETHQTAMNGTGDEAHIAEHHETINVGIGYVQQQIGRHIKERDGKTSWRELLDIMQACMPALFLTRQYMTDQIDKYGFVEGHAWEQFVWKLKKLAERYSLPHGITKSDDPEQACPFVRLMRELQAYFPERFRRHNSSYAALAQAMGVACRRISLAIARHEAEKINASV